MTLADYNQTCFRVSRLVMARYSTSFWWGTLMFPLEVRTAIAAIYGFTRLADEAVDTFHEYDKAAILESLKNDLDTVMARGLSTNPLIQAFQLTMQQYGIGREYINAFLKSMEMDLTLKRFNRQQYEAYVYGSAEVIGLMCLKVFCQGQPELFDELVSPGRKLGSAFQKVNFLRDIKSDLETRGRIYLPGVEGPSRLNDSAKRKIEAEIAAEFKSALSGIRRLPRFAKVAVYFTYLSYQALFEKLRRVDMKTLLSRRVRANNFYKSLLLIRAWLAVCFGQI